MPAAGEQTVLVQTSYGLVPIGWVQSALRVLDDAPNQRDGAPRAWIRFDEQVAEGAKDLRPGDEIVARAGLRIEVDALEAIDGTPVVERQAGHRPARMTRGARPTSRWAGPCV